MVSKKIEAEVDSKESESKYISLHENVPVGLFRATPEGSLISANPAFANMLGYYDVNRVKQISVNDLFSSVGDMRDMLRTLQFNKVITDYEVRLLKKNKDAILCSMNLKAIFDEGNNIKFYDGMVVDITERKRNQQKLLY